MIARLVFIAMVAIALDHFSTPGYLKSFTNTRGPEAIAHLTSPKLRNPKECRTPTTELDRLLIKQGVPCL